ncbi:MAG: hypothetical protein COS49_01140 [Candidatus Portnoybacteria bacterium CG03_land_8_20_14_0_80_41_10]|uniref:Glycosyltransferase RgtA/B/C/D-like domain-containing protein n=1 Tax=Candidatus Portnoybacteria bacterium CG03_land_8_20_14_0_80_41_10 TaxID=1974808 RepID=A0A2M7BUT8_9BACT|nr:MAG: hypothetical protein COS49_01140 [Candidatus Portnoybacteria bacterium CG03_land_8_20_14_0_80_41_10]
MNLILDKLNNKITNFLAAFLLIMMLTLAFFSMRDDSATMDEQAHIPAGYSYISQKDMRLNPEHPPLLKDLAGLSAWLGSKLTAQPIHFPDQIESWQKGVNDQWVFGSQFLYRSGNDADKIILWARLPMLLIMLLLGIYIFKWAKEIYGHRAGLLALLLYSFSPTFLAHSRYVTTDVGAAAAFFIAAYYLIKWLQKPSKRNLVWAGLVFGLALLTKFSLALLIPYFIFLVIVWVILKKQPLLKSMLGLLLIGLIGLALIWPVYQFHVWNYPVERQLTDTQFHFRDFAVEEASAPVIWMADKPLLRPYGQFFLGFLMVMRRVLGGNTTYFLGEVSNLGWHHYFPIVFLIKIPLTFLIFILIALFLAAWQIKKPFWQKPYHRTLKWLKNHLIEFAFLSFLVLYWATSIKSNLNIGVRHILPTFPFLYILVSGQIDRWLNISFWPILEKFKLTAQGLGHTFKTAFLLCLKTYFKYLVVAILLFWYIWGTLAIYPHFLAYFSQFIGGTKNGYKYVTDSNLDWGQDLKRLAQFVEENKIDQIYLSYFGGGSPEYYLGNKYQLWWGDRHPSELPPNSWLAVSATLLQGGRGWPAPGFNQKTGYYNWLNQYEPVEVIGYSIFVYHIK